MMNDAPPKTMIVMDIDGTQLREDIPAARYSDQDLADIAALKSKVEALRAKGVVVVHATNRMLPLYQEHHGTLLAVPDYVTCSASTEIFRVLHPQGTLQRDDAYGRMIADSGFDAGRSRAIGEQYAELRLMEGVHLTDRKVSFRFDEDTPIARRHDIFNALSASDNPGASVFMVEDPETHIIDFLPSVCTKRGVVDFLARQEIVAPGRVFVVGNSNNDIPMFAAAFNCAAVGNARDSLKNHVSGLQEESGDTRRYVVAPDSNARGVSWALDHFRI